MRPIDPMFFGPRPYQAEERSRFSAIRVVESALAALLAGVILAIWLGSLSSPPPPCLGGVVPDLAELHVTTAAQDIAQRGWTVEVDLVERAGPPDRVFDQSPKPGFRSDCDEPLEVSVSVSRVMDTPDFLGDDHLMAIAEIEALGGEAIVNTAQSNLLAGSVVGQIPLPMEPMSAVIVLTVAVPFTGGSSRGLQRSGAATPVHTG